MENLLPSYLQDSFEASSLTIVEIIQILTHHGISLPAARQRKAFYVELLHKSLDAHKSEWLAELNKNKNPFQSFSESPVVVSPLRKSPRRTPKTLKTPVKPSVKTPYVVRTQAQTASKSSFVPALVFLVAIVLASNWLQFCNDAKVICVPCPRFSTCVGRVVESCRDPSYTKKMGWWVADWNVNWIPWPFNIEYCQDKSRFAAKETKKLLKLGMIYNSIYREFAK
jgi:hypothetical protein